MTIKSSAISIVVMNIFFCVLAGLAIFPALHSFGYEPREGPGLLFKILLPMVFKSNASRHIILFGILSAVLICGFNVIFLLELNVSNFTKNDNTKRKKVAVIGRMFSVFSG